MVKKHVARPSWVPRLLMLGGVLILLIGVAFLFRAFRTSTDRPIKLNALPTQQLMPFGNEVLHYDGMMLHCLTTGGTRRWSFQIGQGAGFHTNGKRITAWSANQLYILNRDGRAIYNDKMDAHVQFARAGNNYVAAFVGTRDEGNIHVIDGDGKSVDVVQVTSSTLLDVGFFSESPELMWTLGLETTGTVPSTTMRTYEPGKLITGSATLGEQLIYRVQYHNGKLRVVDTRQIRTYDYRIKEDTSVPTVLIYGWYLQDSRQVGRELIQLLVPTVKQDGSLSTTDLRLLTGNNSRVLHLPAPCVGAVLGSKAVFGFSGNYVYMCHYGNNSFSAFTLPIQVSKVIGITQNDRAIVADANAVYLVQLPK